MRCRLKGLFDICRADYWNILEFNFKRSIAESLRLEMWWTWIWLTPPLVYKRLRLITATQPAVLEVPNNRRHIIEDISTQHNNQPLLVRGWRRGIDSSRSSVLANTKAIALRGERTLVCLRRPFRLVCKCQRFFFTSNARLKESKSFMPPSNKKTVVQITWLGPILFILRHECLAATNSASLPLVGEDAAAWQAHVTFKLTAKLN